MAKRVLVVGLGNMGMSHALAYTRIPGYEVVGVCERRIADRTLPPALAKAKKIREIRGGAGRAQAGRRLDQHVAGHPRRFRHQGDGGRRACLRREAARRQCRQRREGRRDSRNARGASLWSATSCACILPGSKFVEIAPQLGKPLVMRMNLNQQSKARPGHWHKRLMEQLPAVVDCGVHYVDVMCQMTSAKPVRVHAIGAQVERRGAPDEQLRHACRSRSRTDRSAGTRPAGGR